MKAKLVILAVGIGLMASSIAQGAEKVVPGPRGGRLLESKPMRAEFFVNPERKVEIAFYDESLKAVPVSDQVVSVIAEAKSGKAKLDFEKKGDVLVSTAPLPPGGDYTVVVQIRPNAQEKPQNFRVVYHDGVCGSCKQAEYACTCVESHEDEHGHSH